MLPSFRFLGFNHLPNCTSWVDKIFDGYWALNFAHSGELVFGVNGGPLRRLTAPVAWWTWPGPRFTYGCERPPGWNHYYVTFTGTWARELFQTGWLPLIPSTAFRVISDPDDFFLKMIRLHGALAQRDEQRAWSDLLGLLVDIRDSRVDSSTRLQRLLDCADAIRKNPSRTWTEEMAARSCAVSRPHFRRLFKNETGLPFHQFCLQARMDFAAALLRNGRLPIKEVCSRCGMSDIYQFYRQFRQHHGMPPAKYLRTFHLK